jgi:chromosomal replication initiation ATPase DnaA
MTTATDSKQYTESQYKRLYKTLLNDHHTLRTKYVQASNENKLLKAKIERPLRQDVGADIQKVKDVINNEFGLDIDVKIRQRDVIDARSMYYRYLRDNTLMSLTSIANTLETNHDHSTLCNSLNKHDDNMNYDKVYRGKYEIILTKIAELNTTQNEDLQNMPKSV